MGGPGHPRCLLCFALAALAVLRPASGGPDKNPLSSCVELMKALKHEDRHVARGAVQALQALQSYLGHSQLGRPVPLSSVKDAAPSKAVLEGWKAGNASVLQRLLEGAGAAKRLGGSEAAAALAGSCLSSRLHKDGFAGRPVVSILLNYFKRPQVVSSIAANLRKSCAAVAVPCELVVNVDNPHEAGAWAAEAGFVVPVFSSNLHESRGYNRAAKVARGHYLIVWQDDQVPPRGGQWLIDMIRVFDAWPLMGIIGMNTYRLCKHMEPTNRAGFTHWNPDPKTGANWTFAQTVDFAPLAIRASIFSELGGLDEGLSRPGDCGIWGDWELSTRAWMGGWQVGYMFMDGRSGDGQAGGTHTGANAEKCWGRQQQVAMTVYNMRFGADALLLPMCERVWALNMMSFTPYPALGCPYNTTATWYGSCTALAPAFAATFQLEQAALLHARGGVAGAPAASVVTVETGAAAAAAAPVVRSTTEAVAATKEGGGAPDGAGGTGGVGVIEITPHLVRGGTRRARD